MTPPSILMTEHEDVKGVQRKRQRTSLDSIKNKNAMNVAKLLSTFNKTRESRGRTRISKLLTLLFLYTGLWLTSLLFIRQIPRPLQQFWINIPWWLLISFGAYVMGFIGWHLASFQECPEAHQRLQEVREGCNLIVYLGNQASQKGTPRKGHHIFSINEHWCVLNGICGTWFLSI